MRNSSISRRYSSFPNRYPATDRTSSDVISVAGVGFQLAALPIGIERGWITRDQGHARARQIIDALQNEPSNRKAGLFYHFINPHDASARRVGRELVVSTVDSALLFSGMLVAGQYYQLPGIYTDTLTAETGCDSILTTTIAMLPLPDLTVSSSLTGWFPVTFAVKISSPVIV